MRISRYEQGIFPKPLGSTMMRPKCSEGRSKSMMDGSLSK